MWQVQWLHQLAALIDDLRAGKGRQGEPGRLFELRRQSWEPEEIKGITADRIENQKGENSRDRPRFLPKHLEEYWLEHACEEDIRKHRENSVKELAATEPDAHKAWNGQFLLSRERFRRAWPHLSVKISPESNLGLDLSQNF